MSNRTPPLAPEGAKVDALAALDEELRRARVARVEAARRERRIAELVSALTGSTLLMLPYRQQEQLPHVPERMLR